MSEDPDDLRAQIVQAAVRGWETNLDGRSLVEQALTRAVQVFHLLLGFSAQPPDAPRIDEGLRGPRHGNHARQARGPRHVRRGMVDVMIAAAASPQPPEPPA